MDEDAIGLKTRTNNRFILIRLVVIFFLSFIALFALQAISEKGLTFASLYFFLELSFSGWMVHIIKYSSISLSIAIIAFSGFFYLYGESDPELDDVLQKSYPIWTLVIISFVLIFLSIFTYNFIPTVYNTFSENEFNFPSLAFHEYATLIVSPVIAIILGFILKVKNDKNPPVIIGILSTIILFIIAYYSYGALEISFQLI